MLYKYVGYVITIEVCRNRWPFYGISYTKYIENIYKIPGGGQEAAPRPGPEPRVYFFWYLFGMPRPQNPIWPKAKSRTQKSKI